ncbi:MAG: LysM domain-containing protein [Bacteroidota bacterium]
MTDPLQLIMQQTGVTNSHFSPTSRYFGIAVEVLQTEQQGEVAYVKRRMIAPPEHFQLLQEHSVTQGERLDHIAHQYLGDPEQFWRICDANAAMHPNELTEHIGSKIRITLPEGVPTNENNA